MLNSIRPWKNIYRRKSKKIFVGSVPIGGDAPISVQSMTNTLTPDVKSTLSQINACVDVGADIREAFNNYPIFVLSKENEILAYLVKFPNSTGIVSANKNLIPVILLDDLLKYLGC